jgi:hypothetical protein
LHLRKSRNAGGGHDPLAHSLGCRQKAPGGFRHEPPVHGVLRGQSAAEEQVAQFPPGHAWVMHPVGVQGSEPDWTQYLLARHAPPAQSEAATQGAPPGSAQTPPVQLPIAQSLLVAQAAQTLPVQRWLPQVTSWMHGSPTASLHSPAWQTPLKQSAPCVHASPKWPTVLARLHAWPTSQVALDWQWFTRSSTPLGRSKQAPS